MSFSQLILRNLLGNRRTYASYFLSSVVAALIFYIFSMLLFHPQMEENLSNSLTISQIAKFGLQASLVVIALLSLLFLWYTFVSFLKRRKRDLAIYMTLGIEGKDLRKLLFFENACLGITATVLGIIIGIIFTKLILLVAQNVMHLDNGLRFYVPMESVLLTFSIYSVLFLGISFFSTLKIQQHTIVDLTKEDEKPRPEPQAKKLLVAAGFLALLGGYGCVLYFSQDSRLLVLLAGVLLTICGTMLLFYQGSVFVLNALKRHPRTWQQTRLLTISDMIFRMRDNAMMYSLITLSASVAFVGISVMMALGADSFADIKGPSFAYVLTGYGGATTQTIGRSEETQRQTAQEIMALLEESGYDAASRTIKTVDVTLPNYFEEVQETNISLSSFYSVISYTDYEALMKQLGETPQAIDDTTLLALSSNGYASRKDVQEVDEEDRKHPVTVVSGTKERQLVLESSPQLIAVNIYNLAVASDKLYAEMLSEAVVEEQEENSSRLNTFTFVDYAQWSQDADVDKRVMAYLTGLMEENERKVIEVNEELEQQAAENQIEAVPYEQNPYIYQQFSYASKYTSWQENRQGNGIILMITVLLGIVFFSFAASILYFRLFADLEKDGAYHRSLHILGVTIAERHRIVANQLRVMYFLPAVVAAIHLSVALLALYHLSELPVWSFYGKIILTYLLFQLVFYLVCKIRYLHHLDHVADPSA